MAKEIVGGSSEQVLYLTRENDILRRELLAQGEQLNREILDRKAETDRLKIEIRTLKRLLARSQPELEAEYQKTYAEELQKFDPDWERAAS